MFPLTAAAAQDEGKDVGGGSARTFSSYQNVILGWPGGVQNCCGADARTRDETGAVNSDWGSVASDTHSLPTTAGAVPHARAIEGDRNWSNTEAALSYRRAAQAPQEVDVGASPGPHTPDREGRSVAIKSVRSRSGSRGRSASSRVDDLASGSIRVTNKRKGQMRKDLIECMHDGSLEPQASAEMSV
jgi:hypothetical protein